MRCGVASSVRRELLAGELERAVERHLVGRPVAPLVARELGALLELELIEQGKLDVSLVKMPLGHDVLAYGAWRVKDNARSRMVGE